MIRRYDFGSPWTTGAIARPTAPQAEALPYWTAEQTAAGLWFTLPLTADERIYGLGETMGSINKRGRCYQSWNIDDSKHTEDKLGLYASHNFLLFVNAARTLGVYFDDPGHLHFDLGCSRVNEAQVVSTNGDLSVYLIEADSPTEVCRAFRGLIGPSYLPPKWAFGYIQSRWGYRTEEDIRTVAAAHRARHIPLDGVSMDIDYMEDFKDFTWDREKFPDLPGLNADMAADHLHLVPIMDAGIKAQEGYGVSDEGIEKGYFCTKADGTPFIGAVWPGRCYFADFLRPEVRGWFGAQYRPLLEAGVEGFWNDMNEPALFYTPESLDRFFAKMDELRPKNIGIYENDEMHRTFGKIANGAEDYRSFWHELDGKRVRHDKVHNLYGAMMSAASAEGLRSFDPDKRFLLFSRSSFIGAHRVSGVWQGDNSSWWPHLLLNLQMMPSLNMCGFLYTGADIGGFGSDTTPELLLRWLQIGVFTPLFRNHSALGTADQEIYRFENWAQMRDVITVRYALLPYLYSEFMQAALTDGLMSRPLAFDYPADADACATEDQLMLGSGCMIAPVLTPHANGRHVYLPEDMLLIRFRSAEDYDLALLQAGHRWVTLQTNEFPLFVRKGCLLPLAAPAEYAEGVDDTQLTLLGCAAPHASAEYLFYRDDGHTVREKLVPDLRTLTAQADETGLIRRGVNLA